MQRRARIILEYLSAFVVISALLLAIAGVVVVKFYGDDLQTYVMDQINNRLDSKLSVEEVSVEVFHKFPNTSLVLKDIVIWSSHNFNARDFENDNADTLLTAETVSISFNLIGLIRKKYNIRHLDIKNGVLNLFTDKSGEGNYKLLLNESRRKKSDQSLNLTNFRISNFQIILNNKAKQLKSSGRLDQLDLNGKFAKHNTQIKASLDGYLEEVSNKGILYASEREIEARLNLNVKDSTYIFKTGQIQIDRIVADMDGKFHVHPGSGVELDLYAVARNLEIHEVLDLLPSQMSNPLQEIRGNGILQLDTRITGRANSTLTPQIEANFQTSNANLQWDRFPFSIKNLNLTGTYSNGGEFNPVTTSLSIESLSAVVGSDHLEGNGRIHNFLDPDFSFDLKGDIHPEQWIGWYGSIPIQKATGTLISDINVSGSYDRMKTSGSKFLFFDISGGISLENVMLKINKAIPPISDINGTVFIDNDFWEPSFSGSFESSDFTFAGSVLNMISFLMDRNSDLVASATFRSNHLDLQEILDLIRRTKTERKASFNFPENLSLKLDFIFNEFSKGQFEASSVRGIAQYDAPYFYIDSISMQTMDGTLMGSLGMVQNNKKSIFTSVDASLYNLDIHQLFKAFNNFGQTQITDKHLEGSISGTSIFTADFNSSFVIRTESILCETAVTIQDGELNGFSPIMALSRFIEVEELQNIKFKKLTNNILIKDSQVIIPAMDIQSNALNLSASGNHGFDNRYDYRLKLKMSEILYNKARGAQNHEFEIAEDELDTRTLFLKIYDEGSGSNVELDREKTARKIRNDLKQEKSELKKILNEELGLFKNDESVVDRKEQDTDQEEIFKFEFSDETDTASMNKKKPEKSPWWKNRTKKDTLQNKPVREFVIDEKPF